MTNYQHTVYVLVELLSTAVCCRPCNTVIASCARVTVALLQQGGWCLQRVNLDAAKVQGAQQMSCLVRST
jgi:hypothetical protein